MKDEEAFELDTGGQDLEHLEPPSRPERTRRGSLFRNFGFGGGRRRTSTLSASLDEADEDAISDEELNESATLFKSRSYKARSKTWDANAGQNGDDLQSSRELSSSKRRSSQAYDDDSDQNYSAMYTSGVALKKRTISLYVSLCELKSFIQLNKTGFSKALKKYDKTLHRDLRGSYMAGNVHLAYPFTESTTHHLVENIASMEKAYANLITNGNVPNAKRELRLHLREHVVWERNTVWREMIGIERKAQAANLGFRRTLLGGDHDPVKARRQGDEPDEGHVKELITPVGRLQCPPWLLSSTFYSLLGIIAIFILLLFVPIMTHREQQNCLAMLVFVSLLWATEVKFAPGRPCNYC